MQGRSFGAEIRGLLDQSLNHIRVQYNHRQSGIHVSKVVMGFSW